MRKDGTVVVTRDYSTGSLNVKSWKNVVAIYTGTEITVGLRNDGTVIAACDSSYGQCSVGGWKLFDSLAAFEKKVKEEEAEQAKQAALLAAKLKEEEAERAKKASRRVAGLCQYCGGTFKKSFLQYKCMTCGHKKDY